MSFRKVQPSIAEYARRGPEELTDVLTFVLLTIQQPIEGIPAQFASVKRQGSRSRYLFGVKREGFEHARKHATEIFEALESMDRTLDRLVYLANLPGFGLPKAGFILQLVYGEAGCMDTHNLDRFGIKPGAAFRIKGLKPETQLRKAADYLRLTEKCGGPEALWNDWCQYVASKRPYVGTAEEVSGMHNFYCK